MNYWEPAHYLMYGYGLQTWEYSPQYALRSYYYLWHYIPVAKLVSFLTANKVSQISCLILGFRRWHFY